MQNDLISRSALIKTLSEKYSGLCDAKDTYQYAKYDAFKEIVRLIKGEPIAYDVEKVVRQLEEKLLHEVCLGCGYLKDNICTYKGENCMVSKPAYESIKKVFADASNGGKE